MKKIVESYHFYRLRLDQWSRNNLLGIFLFNLVIIILVLLRSADYFRPFFPLSINLIFFIGFILLPILLKVSDRTLFFIASLFWIFSTLLKLFRIDTWAERSSIYCFQAFFVGLMISFFNEFVFPKKKPI